MTGRDLPAGVLEKLEGRDPAEAEQIVTAGIKIVEARREGRRKVEANAKARRKFVIDEAAKAHREYPRLSREGIVSEVMARLRANGSQHSFGPARRHLQFDTIRAMLKEDGIWKRLPTT